MRETLVSVADYLDCRPEVTCRTLQYPEAVGLPCRVLSSTLRPWVCRGLMSVKLARLWAAARPIAPPMSATAPPLYSAG